MSLQNSILPIGRETTGFLQENLAARPKPSGGGVSVASNPGLCGWRGANFRPEAWNLVPEPFGFCAYLVTIKGL